jgi:hypothetical protein
MKKKTSILILTTILTYFYASGQETLRNFELNGKVKKVEEVSYNITMKFGEPQNEKFNEIHVLQFDEQGYLISKYDIQISDEVKNSITRRDTLNIVIFEYTLSNNGKINEINEYYKNNIKSRKELKFKTKFKYNDGGKLISEFKYNGDGDYETGFIYKDENNERKAFRVNEDFTPYEIAEDYSFGEAFIDEGEAEISYKKNYDTYDNWVKIVTLRNGLPVSVNERKIIYF